MSRPPFGLEQTRERCDWCDLPVMNPVVYRGQYHHRLCADFRRQMDVSCEITSPYMAEIERMISWALDTFPAAQFPPETV